MRGTTRAESRKKWGAEVLQKVDCREDSSGVVGVGVVRHASGPTVRRRRSVGLGSQEGLALLSLLQGGVVGVAWKKRKKERPGAHTDTATDASAGAQAGWARHSVQVSCTARPRQGGSTGHGGGGGGQCRQAAASAGRRRPVQRQRGQAGRRRTLGALGVEGGAVILVEGRPQLEAARQVGVGDVVAPVAHQVAVACGGERAAGGGKQPPGGCEMGASAMVWEHGVSHPIPAVDCRCPRMTLHDDFATHRC